MNGIIGVTGTPGTGKKSVAPLIAGRLGVRCIGLNELVPSLKEAPGGPETEVDTDELRRKLRQVPGNSVVYGHLLPYCLSPTSAHRVVVLRCEPRELRRRLGLRGYSEQKVRDNVEAELIGLTSTESFEAFRGKAFDIDATSSAPAEVGRLAANVVEGMNEPGPRIDWTLAYDTGAKLRALLGPSVW